MTDPTESLRFTADHEWVRTAADGHVLVGITEHAQSQLGDLVFVQLPEVGAHFTADAEMAVIESVKAAGDIKAPVSGTVVEVNTALAEDPSLANSAPMNGGWFVKLRMDDPAELERLLSADAYDRLVQELA